MNASELKRYIYENNKIEYVLEALGCHSIKNHNDVFITCGNPDGDNRQAITVYADEYLRVINYTRQISKNPALPTDIINLVEFIKDLTFIQAIKYLCDILGLDYYAEPEQYSIPSLVKLKQLQDMQNGYGEEECKPVKPIPEKILSYYRPYVNDMFRDDGIPYEIQREWEIGYDEPSNRITIPIRDELGNLVGVKGRLFSKELKPWEEKYIYLEPVPRGKILYGLYKTGNFIKQEGVVLIGEAEKSVLQMVSYGYPYCVATGGTTIAKSQIDKICRLNAKIIFCFDKDFTREKLEFISKLFINGIQLFAIVDTDNLLEEKESPSDNKEKFETLINNYVVQIK